MLKMLKKFKAMYVCTTMSTFELHYRNVIYVEPIIGRLTRLDLSLRRMPKTNQTNFNSKIINPLCKMRHETPA